MERKSRWPLVVCVMLIVVIAPVIGAVASPIDRPYSFLPVDHPVDMWRDGDDRWAYYSVGFGKPSTFADKIRPTLLADGYREDGSSRPWYRFAKGKFEVIVCDHSEFAVNGSPAGSKLVRHKSPISTTPLQCVLVKNGPGTKTPQMGFWVKKMLFRW